MPEPHTPPVDYRPETNEHTADTKPVSLWGELPGADASAQSLKPQQPAQGAVAQNAGRAYPGMLTVPGVQQPLWGEWYLTELIGRGTFGTVYKAEKTEYGNTYLSAIKHISIPGEKMTKEALIDEGIVTDENSLTQYYDLLRDQIIKEINFCYELKGHTNIVSYEDHCIIPKRNEPGYDVFIRMEFLTPLTKYVRERNIFEKDVVRLGIDMCEALEILDRKKMIHRDIKPANIFVNALGIFKLGDFGESKVLSGATVGMTVRGTYAYMSPEISRGHTADIRSDIYSLGIVLYRLLNGNRNPFIDASVKTVSSEVQESANIRRFSGEPLPPPQFSRHPALTAVVLKACEFDPERRWKNPQEMRKALESLLDAKAPSAPVADGTVAAYPAMQSASRQNEGSLGTVPASFAGPAVMTAETSNPSLQPGAAPSKPKKSRKKIWIPILIAAVAAVVGVCVWLFGFSGLFGGNSSDNQQGSTEQHTVSEENLIWFTRPSDWGETVYAVCYNERSELDALNQDASLWEKFKMTAYDEGHCYFEVPEQYRSGYVVFIAGNHSYPEEALYDDNMKMRIELCKMYTTSAAGDEPSAESSSESSALPPDDNDQAAIEYFSKMDYQGWPQERAVEDIQNHGWTAEVTDVYRASPRTGYVYSESVSSTDKTVTLHVNRGPEKEMLDESNAAIALNMEEVVVEKGKTTEVMVVRLDGPEEFTLQYKRFFDGMELSWKDWVNDITCPLTIKGTKQGEGFVRIYVLDTQTEKKLAYKDLYVIVTDSGGGSDLDDSESEAYFAGIDYSGWTEENASNDIEAHGWNAAVKNVYANAPRIGAVLDYKVDAGSKTVTLKVNRGINDETIADPAMKMKIDTTDIVVTEGETIDIPITVEKGPSSYYIFSGNNDLWDLEYSEWDKNRIVATLKTKKAGESYVRFYLMDSDTKKQVTFVDIYVVVISANAVG